MPEIIRAKFHTMDVIYKFIGAELALGVYAKKTGQEAAEHMMQTVENAMNQMAPRSHMEATETERAA